MTMVHSDIISFYPVSLPAQDRVPPIFHVSWVSSWLWEFLRLALFLMILLSAGWFISLPWFLSHCTNAWHSGPKRAGQQTSYSSVQLKQTDPLLVLMESSSSFLAISFGFPLLYIQSPPLGMVSAKQGLHPPPVNEMECKWAYAQGWLTIISYITASCIVYVSQ